ncbi:MAG: thioredoxin family protein [Kiritimatiellaeota bacterium]|nr:thioredoxin family protein [Kiritimatiellota bacterium]
MKRILTFACAAMLLASCRAAEAEKDAAKPDTDGATPGVWTMDLKAAKKAAEEKDLPLFINFTGSDWCGWCVLMAEQVFSQPAWQEYAKENLMLVWIDFPNDKSLVPEKYVEQNKELRKAYVAKGAFPAVTLLGDDGIMKLESLDATLPGLTQRELQETIKPHLPKKAGKK